MIYDLTAAPPMNWDALRYEWAMLHSVALDEIEAVGCVQPPTIARMRNVMARTEAELTIALAKIP